MPQPYVGRRRNAKGEMRYTAYYYDLRGKPRSAGTYEDELEALRAARGEQAGQDGALTSMTLAERRTVTMEQFWPVFRQHHPVEAITMTHYHSCGRTISSHICASSVSQRSIRSCQQWWASCSRTATVPEER
jgi:hypothetical protein